MPSWHMATCEGVRVPAHRERRRRGDDGATTGRRRGDDGAVTGRRRGGDDGAGRRRDAGRACGCPDHHRTGGHRDVP